MDILTLALSLLLVVGALTLILYPLWRQHRVTGILQADPTEQTLENHEARYQAVLAAIKELMFDYEMGKVSEEDYQTLLNKAKLEAADIRRRIDQVSQNLSPAVEIDPALDADIEKLVAQLKNKGQARNQSLLQAVDTEIELLKNSATTNGYGVCPNCAKVVGPEDAFCSRCGQSLEALERIAAEDESLCPECGYASQPDASFCTQCGAALSVVTQETTEKTRL